MIDLILHSLLLGAVVFCGTGGLLAAAVYGVVNVTLGSALGVLAFPFVLLTLGLFKLVINTFLLWLTDKMIDGFEIDSLGTTFMAAVLIAIADGVLAWIF